MNLLDGTEGTLGPLQCCHICIVEPEDKDC